jgi:FKBP-type peptidyl-prolyl cis-trans isomerase FklB
MGELRPLPPGFGAALRLHRLLACSAAAVLLLSGPAIAAETSTPANELAQLQRLDAQPGMRSLPQVRYKVLRSGAASGAHPIRGAAVQVRYEGRYLTGEVFDASAKRGGPDGTAIFPLRALIGGFQGALMAMRPGDEWEVYIPAELAYGAAGSPQSGRALVFRLELVDWAELPPPPSPLLNALPKAR